MQLLRQATAAKVPVYGDGECRIVLNGEKVWKATPVKDGDALYIALTEDDTAECGRLNVGTAFFMVVAQKSYDAFVTGASLFEADVKRINAEKVGGLVDFYTQGYDHETHRITGIDRVETVGRVDKRVCIEDAEIMEALKAIGRNLVMLHDPKRVVKADAVTFDGKAVKTVVDAVMGELDAMKNSKATVNANVVSIQGERKALDALSDFALKGYNSETHSLNRVTLTDKAGEVASSVTANVAAIDGKRHAAKNAALAFDGTGYAFPKCAMPEVGIVKATVNANVEAIKSRDARNLAECFAGDGFGFKGSSIPRVGLVDKVPDVTLKGGALDSLCHEVLGVKQAVAALGEKTLNANVKSVGNSIEAAQHLADAFTGKGYEFPNSTINTRYKNIEARRALTEAAKQVLKEK